MESYCVIGGEGFVGKALVAALLARYPTCTVNSLGLTQRTFLPAPYAFLRTDITDLESLRAAFERCRPTVVFHTASPHPGSSKEVCETVNVAGTAAVLEACRAEAARAGAPVRVVFTSSVTVVYEGVDLINVDERLPRTLSELDSYVATKVRLALAATHGARLTRAGQGRGAGARGEWEGWAAHLLAAPRWDLWVRRHVDYII